MNSFVYQTIDKFDKENPVKPMFGFALEDYTEKYDIHEDALTGHKVFGAIIDKDDSENDIKTIVHMACDLTDTIIHVYDINNASDDHIRFLNEAYQDINVGFSELPDVYEDRIVFASSSVFQKNQRG